MNSFHSAASAIHRTTPSRITHDNALCSCWVTATTMQKERDEQLPRCCIYNFAVPAGKRGGWAAHLVHMGSPALQGSCPLVAFERVRRQRGCIAPQTGLLQRCNALLRQPCIQPMQALSCAPKGRGSEVLMMDDLPSRLLSPACRSLMPLNNVPDEQSYTAPGLLSRPHV